MNAFLILSSLSLAFYLVLLVALYHDGRQRRVNSGPVRAKKLGHGSGLVDGLFTGSGTVGARTRRSPENVLWIPVTKHRWSPAASAGNSSRAHQVRLAKPSDVKDNLRCS
jgi:hypothetical protein